MQTLESSQISTIPLSPATASSNFSRRMSVPYLSVTMYQNQIKDSTMWLCAYGDIHLFVEEEREVELTLLSSSFSLTLALCISLSLCKKLHRSWNGTDPTRALITRTRCHRRHRHFCNFVTLRSLLTVILTLYVGMAKDFRRFSLLGIRIIL